LGITPSTHSLSLENTNIPLNERGFIETNSNFQINNSNSHFAIGDCSGKSLLRHGASFESREVFKQIALQSENVLSQEYMPAGIYLGESEIGSCGKTSQQLKKEGIDFRTHTKKFEDTVYGSAKGMRGKIVLHYHPTTYEILGSHVFGPDGVNLNQIAVPYIEKHQTLFDIADTICPHPSLAEALFTIPIREIVYDILYKTFK
jgi:dihydrolipoamide dehydrogenase